MSKATRITAGMLFLITLAVICIGNQPQKVINRGSTVNDGSGDGLRTAFGKVNDNFVVLWPSRHGTNANHTLPTNYLFHGWTEIAVRGSNTIPRASLGSATNVVRLIIVDEGGNANNTNIWYATHPSDRINGVLTNFSLDSAYESVRLYSAGGTNWFQW